MTFLIPIIDVLTIFHHRKMLKRGDMVGYREGNELISNKVKLYLDISR
ncbi:hypothetical protein MSMAS_0851 [Methanosarcina mazei S-6]|jgi:hypothetical protein|uniref:Uncharacterized protein n=2 Tax=Methanosarcina mazei TaxID=2209 RepID=A0A0E3RDJ9_METMZ|nr:hypothetical protein MSMAP_0818 [Methanosarcina mazei SarPi]AKB64047.1 hypothetical protein MSMAS_0851 [Methanosarcina mazei S-6]